MEPQKFLNNDAPTKKLQKLSITDYKLEMMWGYFYIMTYLHLGGLYGLFLIYNAKFWTIVWLFFLIICSILGNTAGSHRLWSHRSYKAKWPMKLMLMIFQSFSYNDTIYQWVKTHRMHHKYTDTNADPYSINRGFFFAHIVFTVVRRHPEYMEKLVTIDLTDIEQDPFVSFQRRWRNYILVIFGFILPVMIPYWYWNETLWCMWHANLFRILIGTHCLLSINSLAHTWGTKPFDKSITPTNNWAVIIATLGEGWHNFHHVFPWDYRQNEFGYFNFNFTAIFIDCCAFLGLAYDLKTVSPEMIKRRALRIGEKIY